jgi:alkylated DNA repair dioxygenase AlkB
MAGRARSVDDADPPACVRYFPSWVADQKVVFELLWSTIDWQQPSITLFGRTAPIPRLTSWIADGPYRYSGVVNEPKPWPRQLAVLRDRLTAQTGVVFNSCLANLYRDGSDSMGYHSDDEPELGSRPVIGSVSLGQMRTFVLRHRGTKQRWTWRLGEGDLLLMSEESQSDYAHAVPKTSEQIGPRMNLTFRQLLT